MTPTFCKRCEGGQHFRHTNIVKGSAYDRCRCCYCVSGFIGTECFQPPGQPWLKEKAA